jgi:uncharacterized protein GlcG (DUF336 family)
MQTDYCLIRDNAMRLSLTLLFLLPTFAFAEKTSATLNLESLAPHIANKMVVAAVEDCTKRGYKVSAAVVGRDGNLIAFLRNPLSGPHTIETSQRKAYSAASLQAPTSSMKSRPDLSFAPGLLLITGGLPISIAGKFYGGIAVAGALAETDEACARTGIKEIEETLELGE